MKGAAWVHDPADLTRAEVISLHEDNVASIDKRLASLAESVDPEVPRAIADLRQVQADEAELAELARAHEYPYRLAAEPASAIGPETAREYVNGLMGAALACEAAAEASEPAPEVEILTRGDFPVGGSPETVAKWFGFASVAELEASHARYAEEMSADAIAEELAEAGAAAAGAVWPSADELAEMSMYDQEMWERRCADAEAADAEAAEPETEPEAEL